MATNQEGFTTGKSNVGLLDVDPAGTDCLDFSAEELDSRLFSFEKVVLMPRLTVFRNDLSLALLHGSYDPKHCFDDLRVKLLAGLGLENRHGPFLGHGITIAPP